MLCNVMWYEAQSIASISPFTDFTLRICQLRLISVCYSNCKRSREVPSNWEPNQHKKFSQKNLKLTSEKRNLDAILVLWEEVVGALLLTQHLIPCLLHGVGELLQHRRGKQSAPLSLVQPNWAPPKCKRIRIYTSRSGTHCFCVSIPYLEVL